MTAIHFVGIRCDSCSAVRYTDETSVTRGRRQAQEHAGFIRRGTKDLCPQCKSRKVRQASFTVACPTTWPAASVCNAWGAGGGAHGCKLDPGHPGMCRCLCGRSGP